MVPQDRFYCILYFCLQYYSDWRLVSAKILVCYFMFQHSLNMSSSPSNKSSSDSSSHHNHVDSSSGHTQGRPRAGSESSSGRGPVSKVMDIFRHRSHSAVSAEDKRKAVSKFLTFMLPNLKLWHVY
jgi:hypothetical protein